MKTTAPNLRITNIEQAIERLYDLNVGAIGSGSERHERPHKPLMLLAVLDIIAAGHATAQRITWSEELRDRFADYFEEVHQLNDKETPENPFLYLRGDGIWEPIEVSSGAEHPLDRTPTAGDAAAKRIFARLTNGLENYVRDPAQRLRLREAIVSRYFPTRRSQLEPLYADHAHYDTVGETGRLKEEPETTAGRNPAFRRKVLEVYDSQCAACGLRIKLPDADLTFVDGAHLIPFKISLNDHPTNGLALCKNHHWAMDRFLIVPTPEGFWKASPRLDSRRSPGEKALREIDRQPLLPPHDDAFQPDLESLRWRAERIYIG